MRSTTQLAIMALGLAAVPRTAPAVEVDAAALFRQLDGNADGRLTHEEVGATHARLFARLVRTSDDDGDGQLSADELAAGLTPVRADKQGVEKQGSRLPGSDALVVMLVKMDANGDRKLVPGEIPEQFRGLFDAMIQRGDDNKNGELDSREIAQGGPVLSALAGATAARMRLDVQAELAMLPPERREALSQMNAYPNPREMLTDPQQAAELFARLDANGDKHVAVDEAPDGLVNLLRRMDRNGDGKLNEAEFRSIAQRGAGAGAADRRPAGPRRNMRQVLTRLDRNGDGVLSRDELPGRMGEAFDRLDADQSGAVDAEEFERFRAQGRPRPGRPFAEQDSAEMDEEMQ
jgi:Ca2+-binding EF-hand superfamily protein